MTHVLQEAAFVLNIPDVWHVRNGMLWANPFEQARFGLVLQLCTHVTHLFVLYYSCTYVTHELSCCIAVQAWNQKDVALFWDAETSSLFVRVLTEKLMSTRLMDYKTCAAALCKSCLLNMTPSVTSTDVML